MITKFYHIWTILSVPMWYSLYYHTAVPQYEWVFRSKISSKLVLAQWAISFGVSRIIFILSYFLPLSSSRFSRICVMITMSYSWIPIIYQDTSFTDSSFVLELCLYLDVYVIKLVQIFVCEYHVFCIIFKYCGCINNT